MGWLKTTLIWATIFISWLARAAFAPGQTVPPHQRALLSADALQVADGNRDFAVDIYRRLSADADPSENLLVSPFSISTALAMTYAGARGRTAEQMANVLKFSLSQERLHPALGELIRDLNVPRQGYQLSVANRLFGQSGYSFQQPFLELTGRDYGAPLEQVNFVGDHEGSRQRINHWVEDQTHNRIRDLLPQGAVTPDTRLVLTNAVYLDATWKHQFDKARTFPRPFYLADGAAQQVSMMHQLHSFRYAESPACQMLEMPYAGDDLSMLVLLPRVRDGLTDLEASLSSEFLKSTAASLQNQQVSVSLPKFTFDSSFGLSDVLKAMGMIDAFSNAADFSSIGDRLSLSNVLHKTFVAVDEEGTEAAAATAVTIVTTSAFTPPPDPKVFLADHPFLFALWDRHTESALFLGRVTDAGALAAVPEPATFVLLVTGAAAIGLCRFGKQRRTNGA